MPAGKINPLHQQILTRIRCIRHLEKMIEEEVEYRISNEEFNPDGIDSNMSTINRMQIEIKEITETLNSLTGGEFFHYYDNDMYADEEPSRLSPENQPHGWGVEQSGVCVNIATFNESKLDDVMDAIAHNHGERGYPSEINVHGDADVTSMILETARLEKKLEKSEKEHKKVVEKLRKELDLAKKNIPDESELKDIQLGESTNREFKSTFRFNLHTKKNDPEKITYACLKTIAGFLNTTGGSLYIGITDSGEIFGIEKDGFSNNDKFQTHVFDLIKDCLGKPVATLVDTQIINIEKKDICVVKCKKSPEPVYLKFKKEEESYFVRTGPSTIKLSTSETVKHIKEHFE